MSNGMPNRICKGLYLMLIRLQLIKDLLPTGSEESEVLGVRSISCCNTPLLSVS